MQKIFLTQLLISLAVSVRAQEAPEQPAPQSATPPPSIASAGSNEADRVAALMDAGLQYASEGGYKEAEQAYLSAWEKDPGNETVQFRLGTLYIQMKRYKEAANMLRPLCDKYPNIPVLNNNLAWIYATGGEMKNGQLALRYARETILSAPLLPPGWNTLAEAHYILGEYEQALRASEHAIELLYSQEGSLEEDLQNFQLQYQKIQRANESYKMMLNLDGDK
ncbi:MAG: tetratricopeptide repeat protein [Kiritimatiellales bacterium]|nr:tetratricopeptide repeat protein [Kiritimatiellales bacterium]